MEITKNNFSDQFDNITKDIKKSSFIGFDAEFTAILSGECFKHRLFDTNEERYNKIKNEISNMIMTQIGLTMFEYNRDNDSYTGRAYTFHLCPQQIGDIDQAFIFQASTLKFLCKHKFNFNKFIYEGLPYLSKSEQDHIHQQIKDNTLLTNLINSLELDEEKQLQHCCSEVSKWLTNSVEETLYFDIKSPVFRYIVHNEIRTRFPDVLTTDSLGNSNKILIYRNKHVEGAISAPIAVLKEKFLNHVLGFSHIVSLLETHKKPIIAHNSFLDMALFHNQFIGPLPKKYSSFKKNINKTLPAIFDTKYISHEMGKKLTFDQVWKSNALQDLYEFFVEGKCKKLETGVNTIKLNIPFKDIQSYHEAGWDSYCSGYCFIRLGHWTACENRGKYRPVGPTEMFAAMTPYCNKINIIRGAVRYMDLVNEDPPCHRPDLLHIMSLTERTINVGKMATLLGAFGSIDIKPYGTRTALIATNSQNTADKILTQFKNSNEYRISMYNMYKHSPTARMALLGGALITGSLVLYLLHKKGK